MPSLRIAYIEVYDGGGPKFYDQHPMSNNLPLHAGKSSTGGPMTDVVRSVVEGLGVGGGHRSMAKGIIPLKAFREIYGNTRREQVESALFDAFMRAIHEERE